MAMDVFHFGHFVATTAIVLQKTRKKLLTNKLSSAILYIDKDNITLKREIVAKRLLKSGNIDQCNTLAHVAYFGQYVAEIFEAL